MALNNFEISKTLAKSDVPDKVCLPVDIVEHMEPVKMNGENSVELEASDRWGQKWPLKYYSRPDNSRKPVFTVGWNRLVTANSVLPGDKLIFSGHHQDAGEMQYMIQVIRRTRTSEGRTVEVEVIKTVHGGPVIFF